MRIAVRSVALLCALVSTGCIVALHPIVEPKDAADVPALVGVWSLRDVFGDEETWTFEVAAPGQYRATCESAGPRVAAFTARLGRMGESLYLDLSPLETTAPTADQILRVPAHLFARVELDGDVLRLAWLDVRRVAKAARAGELNHETLDDGRLVLTDSTARLQEFMSRDDSVFLAPIEYRRKQ